MCRKPSRPRKKQAAAESGGAAIERAGELLASADTIANVAVVMGEIPNVDADALRGAIDWIRQKTPASAVLLVTTDGAKVTLIAGMSKDAVKRGLKAGDLIKTIAPHVGGRGGGRPDMAQGGGNDPEGIPQALAAAPRVGQGAVGLTARGRNPHSCGQTHVGKLMWDRLSSRSSTGRLRVSTGWKAGPTHFHYGQLNSPPSGR
jgi:hypothetical protein